MKSIIVTNILFNGKKTFRSISSVSRYLGTNPYTIRKCIETGKDFKGYCFDLMEDNFEKECENEV